MTDLVTMAQADFSALFRGSAIKRAKRAGMPRNALLAARELPVEALDAARNDSDEGIRAARESRQQRDER